MKLLNRLRRFLHKRKKPKRYFTKRKGQSRGMERPVPVRRRKRDSFLRKLITRLAVLGVFIMAGLLLTLPDIDKLNSFTKAPSILIKSEDGQIIGSFGDIYGNFVSYEELPNSLVDAVLATEDRNFYHHFGIDPFGLLRATFANMRAGHVVQGGSTITQQVAKNVFLTPERSLLRKVREALLAFKLEYRFTKEEILSIYVNRVYMGAGSYGVEAASRRYFDKPASEMTLSESAIIAGLLKAPSRFAPTSDPIRARKRADQVLVNMEDAGYLTKAQTQKARDELERSMGGRKRHAKSTLYFADWIADQLPDYMGTVQEDIVVFTTLKPELQLLAEKAIADVLDKEGEKMNVSQAALVSMTPDGAVRAMIGGRSYAESQYNRAAQAQRQPGSAFKPFVYLAGLEAGLTPDTLVEDKPITIGKWQPKNYTGEYLGNITIKEALTHSINTVAVQVSETVGRSRVIEMARRLGIDAPMEPVPSIALGATEVTLLELTGAYAHLAAGGEMVRPYGIVGIATSKGRVLYEREEPPGGVVLSGNVVGMMNDMLMNVVTSGTGRGAQIGRPAAGKTGTTSDYRDAWFIGYTPNLATGVWVGNDNNTPMKKVTGGTLPAPIWRQFMKDALANEPVKSLPTSGSSSSALPWQKDVELGPSFWNKLMGSGDAPPEHEEQEIEVQQPPAAVEYRY